MQIKKSLKILNSKEKKVIIETIHNQWGVKLEKSTVMFKSNKDRLYIAPRDVELIDFPSLKYDKIGLYVTNISDSGIRLTIEGSQIIGPEATKNIHTINDEELIDWIAGNDLERKPDMSGFVIIKNKNDFIGTGKVTGKGVLNFIPKSRRITANLN